MARNTNAAGTNPDAEKSLLDKAKNLINGTKNNASGEADLNKKENDAKLNSNSTYKGEFIFNAMHFSKKAREIKVTGEGANEAEACNAAAAKASKQLKDDEYLSYTQKFKKLNRE